MEDANALVCDVGHVLTHGSLLNAILKRYCPDAPQRVLYDMDVLADASADEIERWVRDVMTWKVELLKHVSLRDLLDAADAVPVTEGAGQMLRTAAGLGWRVYCVGAVPEPLIAALIARLEIEVEYAGTSVCVADDRITGVERVLTPRGKRFAVERWMARYDVDARRTVVIGDSIGDLPMMSLVPFANRVAFNAQAERILAFCAHGYSGSMTPLHGVLFNG